MKYAKKRFGQHFLQQQSIVQRIVDLFDPRPNQHIIEIGPGRGALTKELLSRIERLEVVEIDRDMVSALNKQFLNHPGLVIHNADALKFDFSRLKTNGQRLKLIGNLPYNISTPLLFHLISFGYIISDMLFMLQKEVVDRLVAEVGTKQYGRLSVMVAWRCRVKREFNIKPGAFVPPPKVGSSIVHLQPHEEPLVEVGDPIQFEKIVRIAFGKRRKTLRNALKEVVAEEDFEAAGINPQLRPEQLSIDQFGRLSISSYKAAQNVDRIGHQHCR
ncbi:16S rRNA (adenine(1518)-N(6)/adenine(1519)-N(6))-dimethyltransferase RsmA [Pseudomonadota bacterium]